MPPVLTPFPLPRRPQHETDDPLAARTRACVLDLLYSRRDGATICPSDAARALGTAIGTEWRDLMRLVRTVAETMVRDGVLEIVQDDVPVDILAARGPVRLRLKSRH
jgi:hypothetical protein